MQIESSASSTPATLFSKEILYRSSTGLHIQFSLWEVSPSKSVEEQEMLRYVQESL
jgi:hypothetical protein